MPVGGGSYYGPNKDWGSETAYYYVEVLPGETGTVTNGGISYKLHHSDTSPGRGYIVTEEDRYPITGFTYKEGTSLGSNYNNAKFYYTRNSYNIVFINNGTTEKTQPMKYEQSLSGVSYEPTRPDGVPAGYEFAGWYDNEAGEGNAFVFDSKTMPAQNITLYAKWAAPEVTATVYLTVTVGGESRTLSVPYGSSLVEAPGYEELIQEITARNGSAPSAWFSVDGDGAKTLFNPDTKLYAPVTLVPHFSGTLETFTVTYVEGDREGPVDNNSYQSGSYATVLGPKNGNLRFLYWRDEANNKIYKPGESMKMSGNVKLIAVYTEAPATVGLTYHSVADSRTETGIRSNTFATVKSAASLGFTAPTGYVFVGWSTTENGAATYFPGNAVYVPEKGAHLYAVWTERTDLSYTVRYLGNVKEGRPVRYLNLPIEELKKAAIAQMQDGQPVWFGCDVGKCSERDSGIMDLDIRSLEDLLDTRFTMTKAERLDYGQSLMTHAMVFQGVNLDANGKPNRWRVENSWGKEPGKDGYYLMTDRWFDEYMYQVVVNKKYLTPEQQAAYNAEPIALEPWDPMGSLAKAL